MFKKLCSYCQILGPRRFSLAERKYLPNTNQCAIVKKKLFAEFVKVFSTKLAAVAP